MSLNPTQERIVNTFMLPTFKGIIARYVEGEINQEERDAEIEKMEAQVAEKLRKAR